MSGFARLAEELIERGILRAAVGGVEVEAERRGDAYVVTVRARAGEPGDCRCPPVWLEPVEKEFEFYASVGREELYGEIVEEWSVGPEGIAGLATIHFEVPATATREELADAIGEAVTAAYDKAEELLGRLREFCDESCPDDE